MDTPDLNTRGTGRLETAKLSASFVSAAFRAFATLDLRPMRESTANDLQVTYDKLGASQNQGPL